MKNKIIVFIDNSDLGKAALAHGKMLAQVFDTELQQITIQKKTDFNAVLNSDDVHCFVMPIVSKREHPFFNIHNAKKWIKKSRVPVITIGDFEPKTNDYQKIILPLDINCQEKELAQWASFFSVQIQKNCPNISKEKVLIYVIYNEYKTQFLQKKVQNNIEFVKKMFARLEVDYEIHPFKKVDNIHTFGIQYAKKVENSILFYLIPEHNSLIDLIFGSVLNKIMKNKKSLPVLLLNAREDLFVLCQ